VTRFLIALNKDLFKFVSMTLSACSVIEAVRVGSFGSGKKANSVR